MALTDKLTAIATAIRAKTGKTAAMTLDEMPEEIGSIETGGGAVGTGITIGLKSRAPVQPVSIYVNNYNSSSATIVLE